MVVGCTRVAGDVHLALYGGGVAVFNAGNTADRVEKAWGACSRSHLWLVPE
jgi:hypothetical protein